MRTRASLGRMPFRRKRRGPASVNAGLTMKGEWCPRTLSVRGPSERARGAFSVTAGRRAAAAGAGHRPDGGGAPRPAADTLRDAGDRRAWCGRPAITWTYEAAAEIVGRLARGIAAWRLAPGSRIGLFFAGGAESSLAHLAVEAAGHLPCPLSPVWEGEALSAAIESAGLVAVLTEGRRGTRRPAEELAFTALRHFGLRFLAAFGPGLPTA